MGLYQGRSKDLPVTPVRPGKKATPAQLRQFDEALENTSLIAQAQIVYYRRVIETADRRTVELQAAVDAAKAELDAHLKDVERAPDLIEILRDTMAQCDVESTRLQKLTSTPKLEKIARLRAQLAKLEAEEGL